MVFRNRPRRRSPEIKSSFALAGGRVRGTNPVGHFQTSSRRPAMEVGVSSEFRQQERRPQLICLILGSEFKLKLLFLD